MGSEKFCLRWNDFETNISIAFRELRDDKDFFDVTLACDDEQIQAHKVILSACSPFFRNVLRRNPHQHPLLYLKGVKYTDLQSVLNFMYHGEVNVAQEELNSFLAVAEDLRVKGLTQNQSGSSSSRAKDSYSAPKAQEIPKARPPDREPAPPPKRSRPTPPVPSYSTAQDDDDIQEVVPVKTEPREHIPAPTPVEMYHSPSPVVQQQVAPPPPPPSHAVAPPQQSQQLQQMDDSLQYAGDDSYDDYGQYGAEGGYEGGLVDQGMGAQDANKGGDRLLFYEYIVKDPSSGPKSHKCTLCGKVGNDRGNLRKHVENIHFPGSFSYGCKYCTETFTTRNNLNMHISKTHRNVF